jgi:hypothetical protein
MNYHIGQQQGELSVSLYERLFECSQDYTPESLEATSIILQGLFNHCLKNSSSEFRKKCGNTGLMEILYDFLLGVVNHVERVVHFVNLCGIPRGNILAFEFEGRGHMTVFNGERTIDQQELANFFMSGKLP